MTLFGSMSTRENVPEASWKGFLVLKKRYK